MAVISIENDSQFLTVMHNQGVSLVVVDFFAVWCLPCKIVAPQFEELARKYPNATFLKVDVDKCQETASIQGVSSMPTFIIYQNKTKLSRVQGANISALEEKIIQYYDRGESDDSAATVPGYMNLNTFLLKNQCEALNESDDHTLMQFLESPDNYLESDCDHQLIISLTFSQAVKIHSIKFKAPHKSGPHLVNLFINQPTTLDFDSAVSSTPTQKLTLSAGDLNGIPINLFFVKFQNVQNLQIFISSNQGNEETTRIDELVLYGLPVTTTNMSDFKRVAGKKGEAH